MISGLYLVDAVGPRTNSPFTILNSLFKKGRIFWIRPFVLFIQWKEFDLRRLLGGFIGCFGAFAFGGFWSFRVFGVG